jgi:transketolase
MLFAWHMAYANFNCNPAFVLRHPTSCASIAEIMSTLFFHTMRYKVSAPKDASSDRFVLSKGHAAPILYAGNYFNTCF